MRLLLFLCLLAGWPSLVLSGSPRELELRPGSMRRDPQLRFPDRGPPQRNEFPGRPRLGEVPKPPPPQVAYWYWRDEQEAYRRGFEDPWRFEHRDRLGARIPQAGVALGRKYESLNSAVPNERAPLWIHRRRLGDRRNEPGIIGPKIESQDPAGKVGLGTPGECEGAWPEGSFRARGSVSDKGPKIGNQAEVLLEYGKKLLRTKPDGCHQSCISCHAQCCRLEDVFFRYPTYHGAVNRVIGLEERVNLCRSKYQERAPWKADSVQLAAVLTALRELE